MECGICMRNFEGGDCGCMFIEGHEYRICPDCSVLLDHLYGGVTEERKCAEERLRRVCIEADCSAAVKQRLSEMFREAERREG